MSHDTLDALNNNHGIAGQLRFTREAGGPTVAEIDNTHGSARIALEGGQLLTWSPAGQAPVVWLSPQAVYKPGKSLRGGAPICWPWFGPHPDNASLPGHGFARNKPWRIIESSALADGATRLSLGLIQDDETRALWPHHAELTLAITVGTTLEMELTTRNQGDKPIAISEAFHTYFHVSDVTQIAVTGLEGGRYIDKVDGGQHKVQEGPITVGGEVERIYLDSEAECVIDDPGLGRRIRIAKSGSRSTVIWNPWAEKGAAFGDMGDEGYRHMLCVETANVLDNTVTIGAGESHTLRAVVSV